MNETKAKTAAVVGLVVLTPVTLRAADALSGSCGADGAATLLYTLRALLAFVVVAVMTIRHLGQIKDFVLDVMVCAGRSKRRLVALGLLLLFLLVMFYMAEGTTRRLIMPRPAAVSGFALAIAVALWLFLPLDLWFVAGLGDAVRLFQLLLRLAGEKLASRVHFGTWSKEELCQDN
jgi:hypothetical protein